MTRKSHEKPDTWKAFQKLVKKYFLPSQYKEKARHAGDVLQTRERENVSQYTDRFWQTLLALQNVEKVSKSTLKRKYISGLEYSIQAEVNKFRPHSLHRAISLAHDAETAKGRPQINKSLPFKKTNPISSSRNDNSSFPSKPSN